MFLARKKHKTNKPPQTELHISYLPKKTWFIYFTFIGFTMFERFIEG